MPAILDIVGKAQEICPNADSQLL
ncbi:MAG: hypothetical protein ACLUB2_02115 [Butyricicoccus pullicaecorum]